MPKATPIYSAFAIVAIESIWPSANGDEVPINYLDLSYLRERLYSNENPEFSSRADEVQDAIDSNNEVINAFDISSITFTRFSTREKSERIAVSSDGEEVGEGEGATTIVKKEFIFVKDTVERSSFNSVTELSQAYLRSLRNNENFLSSLNASDGFYSQTNLIRQYAGAENILFGETAATADNLGDLLFTYRTELEAEINKQKSFVESEGFSKVLNAIRENENLSRFLLDTTAYGIYPQAEVRPGFSSIFNSEDAYKKRRGYFKIIPLNIISVNTSSSTGGQVGQSTFEISFTLDDVVIIADDYAREQIYNSMPRALPISFDNLDSELNGIFGNVIPEELSNEYRSYGMSVFRVSGNDFPFNIEDIVEANDTATIWFYHDPQEFDFVKVKNDEIILARNEKEIKEANHLIQESNNASNTRREEERGFFVKKATYRTVYEFNETTLDVFIDHGVYVREDQEDLINEIEATNAATLSYLINLKESGGVVNFDNVRLRQRTGVSYHPSLCTPEKIAEYEQELTQLYLDGVRGLATSMLRLISGCEGRTSEQTNLSLDSIITTVTVLTQNELSEEQEVVPEAVEPSPISQNTVSPMENELTLENFVLNKDFSYVIGTASRKSQDDFNLISNDASYTPPRTIVNAILQDSQILQQYTSPEELNAVRASDINLQLSPVDSFRFLVSLGESANLLGTRGGLDPEAFDVKKPENIINLQNLASLAGNALGGVLLRDEIVKNVLTIYVPNIPTSEDESTNRILNNPIVYRRASAAFINSIEQVLLNPPDGNANEQNLDIISSNLVTAWRGRYGDTQIENVPNQKLGTLYNNDSEIKDLFEFFYIYRTTLTKLANDFLKFQANQNIIDVQNVSVNEEGYFNKRKLLVSKSHGETPYLALKGHISEISTKYGASQGANVVSLNGAGYEKILNDNIVYFEDLFSPTGGQFAQATEAYPIYSQMLPPRAMLHLIEMHAPRFIIVGKPSSRYVTAKNMSLYLSLGFKEDLEIENSTTENNQTPQAEPIEETKSIWDRYFDNGNKTLIRGMATVDLNPSGKSVRVNLPDGAVSEREIQDASVRIFYPVNYLNTSRIQEMIKCLEKAYFKNVDEATIKIPYSLASQQSVANNIVGFNGPKEVNHLFVDETGRLRQRMAFEAWERVPNTDYTPIITDMDVLSAGASFSRNSSPVITMVDFRTNTQGSATGIVDARFAGRTLSGGNDYIPLITLNSENSSFLNLDKNLFSNNYEAVSEPFFRYGMRYRLVTDIYTTSTRIAKRKSILYHGFFSKPVKSASITVKGNTSYRAGETVLVSLDSYRYRSREIIDIVKTLNWLNYLKTNSNLIPLYIGFDRRWLNYDTYYKTLNLNDSPEYGYWLNEVKAAPSPEEYILDKFIETFNYLDSKITGTLKFITPEYFPTTLWAFINQKLQSFDNSIPASEINSAYNQLYNQLNSRASNAEFKNIIEKNPGILKAIRMQNFRNTSYYIDSVKHSFVHGDSCTTSLTLTHGQDNLVLIEPYSMRPIGFMSTERRMRIGYDDAVVDQFGQYVYGDKNKNTKDRFMWEEVYGDGANLFGKRSDLQEFYIEQFYQDLNFKKSSFLYEAQKLRNASNFMYELSLDNNL